MFDPFLVVADLIGEGRVDLTVRFTFPLIFQVILGWRSHRARGRSFRHFLDRGQTLGNRVLFCPAGTGEIPFSSVGHIVRTWKLYSRVHLPGCARLTETMSFPCMKWFSKTWVFVFPFMISKGRFFGGRSCLLLKFIPTIMLL